MSKSDGNGMLCGKWQGYTLDTDPDQARALFERKYSHPPAEVVRGPIGGRRSLLPRREREKER